jgi:hypothetical protein
MSEHVQHLDSDLLTKGDVEAGDTIRYKQQWPIEDWVEHVAGPDPDEYDREWSDNSGVVQEGRCDNCEIITVSWVKKGICPECGEKVYMT